MEIRAVALPRGAQRSVGGFQHRLQLAQLRYLTTSKAAATTLAENYVGLPL